MGVRLYRLLLIEAALLALLAQSYAAQGVEDQRPLLSFDPLKGDVQLEYVQRKNVEEPLTAGEPKFTIEEIDWKEALHLETKGFVYHPNLLELKLAGTFGLRQFHLTEQDVATDTNGTLTDFDVEGLLLKQKPYPVTFFARRQTDVLPRQFTSSVQQETSQEGVRLQLINLILPTELSLERIRTRQSESLALEGEGSSLEDLQETDFRWHTQGIFSPNHTLDWNFSVLNQQITSNTMGLGNVSNSFNENRMEADLRDTLTFGVLNQYRLETHLNALDQQSSFSLKQFDWNERFEIKHAENLKTRYRADAQQLDFSGLTQNYARVGAGVNHKLFGSLSPTRTSTCRGGTFRAGPRGMNPTPASRGITARKTRWGSSAETSASKPTSAMKRVQ